MQKPDITSREQVNFLVKTFYAQIRQHKVLSPFFEKAIADWEVHIEKLTNFWEASLFLKTKYTGNPLQTHIKVDKDNNHGITQEHFGLWLNLWVGTIDSHFEGDYAENAKSKARKMATFMFMSIFQSRTQ